MDHTETKRYAQLLKDVEMLMQEISASDLDLDLLVQKVEQGFETISLLRQRLDETKGKIETIKEKFQTPNP